MHNYNKNKVNIFLDCASMDTVAMYALLKFISVFTYTIITILNFIYLVLRYTAQNSVESHMTYQVNTDTSQKCSLFLHNFDYLVNTDTPHICQ